MGTDSGFLLPPVPCRPGSRDGKLGRGRRIPHLPQRAPALFLGAPSCPLKSGEINVPRACEPWINIAISGEPTELRRRRRRHRCRPARGIAALALRSFALAGPCACSLLSGLWRRDSCSRTLGKSPDLTSGQISRPDRSHVCPLKFGGDEGSPWAPGKVWGVDTPAHS